MIKKIIFLVFFFGQISTNFAQNYALPSAQKEFEQVGKIIQKMHPQAIQAKIDWQLEKKAFIEHPDSLWKYIAQHLKKIGCGHTFAVLPDFRKRKNVWLLPGYFFCEAEQKKIFFTENDSAQCREIVKINGKDANFVCRELLKVCRAQAIEGRDLSEKFALYFHLIFGTEKRDFVLQSVDNKTITVKAITFEEWLKNHENCCQKQLSWGYFSDENGQKSVHLDIPDFFFDAEKTAKGMPELLQEWDSAQVKKIRIDLRKNLGGSLMAAEKLFSFFCADTLFLEKKSYLKSLIFDDFEYISLISNRPYSVALHAKISDYFAKNFTGNEKSGYQNKEGYYGNTLYLPAKTTFKGEVEVLVSEETFSAAEHFCRLFRLAKRGKIIGKPTGGSAKTLQADIVLTYTLSGSHISFEIPLVKSVFPQTETERIQPEIFSAEEMPCGR